MKEALCNEDVRFALVSLSRLPVFSRDFGLAFKDDLELLHTLKQLKYFWNLPQSQLAILMANLARRLDASASLDFNTFTDQLCQSPSHLRAIKEAGGSQNSVVTIWIPVCYASAYKGICSAKGPPALCQVSKELPEEVHAEYMKNAAYLEDADAHAVYPTSIYRQ